jgi:hypothetical protein
MWFQNHLERTLESYWCFRAILKDLEILMWFQIRFERTSEAYGFEVILKEH